MRAPAPVLVIDLFPEERSRLLDVLEGLSEEEWRKPTVCEGWSVKDVALHILGDDIGNLSRQRDGHSEAGDIESWDELVAFINEWNGRWVEASRRISVPLLLDLLRLTGGQVREYFASLDPFATGGAVSWAGPEPAPVWLDVAREYTERWLHQQQIREAVGARGLDGPRFLAPVLATFVRALPHTFRGTIAPAGTHVRLEITGEAGGVWSVVREEDRWALATNVDGEPAASVAFDQDTAWRLFTKGLGKDETLERSRLEGDSALASTVLETVSIIA